MLAGEVRAGRDVVVAQPTCAYVIRKDYPIYAPGEEADLVAAHAFDASEYLMLQHRREGGGLDTSFTGSVADDRSPTTSPATCARRTSASRVAT